MSIAHDLKKILDIVGPDIDFSGTWVNGVGRYYVADFRGRLDRIAESLSVGRNKYVTRFVHERGCAQILGPGNFLVIAEVEATGEIDETEWVTVRLVREQSRFQPLFEDLLPDRVSVKIVDSL